MTRLIAKEWPYLVSAVMFYTRIPVPANSEHSQEILNRSRKYFPAVGIIIGNIAVITFLLAHAVFGLAVSIAISMVATILATGAFHEDGFADSCDGLGGGWSTEQVLTIMKDSRVGTYATVGLISMLSLKFLVLLDIVTALSPTLFAMIYISGHTLSRQLSSSAIERYDYVQDIDQSKVKPITEQHLSSSDTRISLLLTAIPLLLLLTQAPLATLVAIVLAAVSAVFFMRYCERRIGGYTGDILGATQQISEVVFYLSMAAMLLI